MFISQTYIKIVLKAMEQCIHFYMPFKTFVCFDTTKIILYSFSNEPTTIWCNENELKILHNHYLQHTFA